MNKVIVITGQTATGKTSLAVQYAKEKNGEIVNADSRQIYKKLDIVTGKDLKELRDSKIRTHLFDIVDPAESFSSFEYVQKAHRTVKDITKRGKTPIIVGGTYFYIRHLLYGHDTEGIGTDIELRKRLNAKTVSELQSLLLRLFKQMRQHNTMNQSDWSNPRRLIRKIEVLHSQSPLPPELRNPLIHSFEVECIGLRFAEKEALVKKVTARVASRLKQGAVEEVKNLLKQRYTAEDPGLKSIGYSQLIRYLMGAQTEGDAIADWITKEIQYAKRQYTFMKKDDSIMWLEVH